MIKFQHTVFGLAVRVPGGGAGGERVADGRADFLDPDGVRVRAIGGDVVQPAARRAVRPAESAHAELGAAGGTCYRGSLCGCSASFCIAGFVISAAMLNRLALLLSPIALAILLGYSLTKRFTSVAHFFLGLALGIAPIGAWVAVRAELDWPPVLLGLAVMLWTAGFRHDLFAAGHRRGPRVGSAFDAGAAGAAPGAGNFGAVHATAILAFGLLAPSRRWAAFIWRRSRFAHGCWSMSSGWWRRVIFPGCRWHFSR
jgi:hypothetical protein